MARRLGYPGPVAMWTDLYVTQGLSVSDLCRRFKRSRTTIWRQLDLHNIPRRGYEPYGPNRPAPAFPTDKELKEKGVEQCADEFGVTPSAIYHRLHRQGRSMDDVLKSGR